MRLVAYDHVLSDSHGPKEEIGAKLVNVTSYRNKLNHCPVRTLQTCYRLFYEKIVLSDIPSGVVYNST